MQRLFLLITENIAAMPSRELPITLAKSPISGGSTFMTSAPWSAIIMPAKGPETVEVNSTTLYPSNGPDIYPPNLYFKFNAKYSVIIDTSN